MELPALLKGSKDNPASIRADIAAIIEKEAAESTRLDELRSQRTDAVEASLSGGENAEKEIARIGNLMRIADDNIADFRRVRARLEDRLKAAEQAKAAAEFSKAMHRLKILAGRREKQLAACQDLIHRLAKHFVEADELAQEIIAAAPYRRSFSSTLFTTGQVRLELEAILKQQRVFADTRTDKGKVPPSLVECAREAHSEFLMVQRERHGHD